MEFRFGRGWGRMGWCGYCDVDFESIDGEKWFDGKDDVIGGTVWLVRVASCVG